MEGLVFKEGGKLEKIRWVYDKKKREGEYVATDVTSDAAFFLMEPVRLEGNIVLRDVFNLLRENELLQTLFTRDWAADYVKAAFAQEGVAYTGAYDPDGIEYLELYQLWEKDSATEEIVGSHRLSFHGVGFELQDDVKDGDWVTHTKGTRINWGIEFSPIHQLINLPLRFNPEVIVCESNHDSKSWGARVATWQIKEPTLGQFLHGILWELSFNGSPEDSQEAAEALRATKTEVDEAIATGDLSKFVTLTVDDANP